MNKHSFFFVEILYDEPDLDRYEHYRAEWELELGDRVAVHMWSEDTFGKVNIISKARHAVRRRLWSAPSKEDVLEL
jgi:hypothetical protein